MWPNVGYETLEWHRDFDELAFVPKSRRRKILPTYEAAVPAAIAEEPVAISPDISMRLVEVEASVARFDQSLVGKTYNLPALLLRSESSSSSQIERLTSSARNVALAEVSDKAPSNAKLIARNITAMRTALAQQGSVDANSVCAIHRALMGAHEANPGLRSEQVWIGGTPYSPHGAAFVPPHCSRVPACLRDLERFEQREDIDPIVKTALFHAQFETIHPFTDGNGRTGRALMHRVLARGGVTANAALPLSAGLLHDVDTYIAALSAYHEGETDPIIESVIDALELAVYAGSRLVKAVDEVLDAWQELITERKGSAAHQLPAVLVEQPVVNTAYVAAQLSISDRAARTLVDTACERGILTKMGSAQRGAFYQASDLIAVLEDVTSKQVIRRKSAS